jgi:hypothetical protein
MARCARVLKRLRQGIRQHQRQHLLLVRKGFRGHPRHLIAGDDQQQAQPNGQHGQNRGSQLPAQ